MKIVFDIETTGLDAEKDEILQFSAIDESGNVWYNQFFKPRKVKEWPEAEAIHHISPEQVADKPYFDECLSQIQTVFDAATEIISYNGEFDIKFLKTSGVNFRKRIHHWDVMKLFAPVYGKDPATEDTWDPYRKHYKWKKLVDAAKYFDYQFDAHDSLEDVKATLHVYKKLQELYQQGKYTPTNSKVGKPIENNIAEKTEEKIVEQAKLDFPETNVCLTRAVGYVRLNVTENDFSSQINKIILMDNIKQWYRDITSNGDDSCPKYEQMLSECQEGDTVYIEKMSRLAKSYSELSTKLNDLIEIKKVNVIFVDEGIDTSTKEGRLILSAISYFEKFSNDIACESRKEGYRKAVNEGRVGRKKKEVDKQLFEENYILLLTHKIDIKQFAFALKVSVPTAKKLIAEYTERKSNLLGEGYEFK